MKDRYCIRCHSPMMRRVKTVEEEGFGMQWVDTFCPNPKCGTKDPEHVVDV